MGYHFLQPQSIESEARSKIEGKLIQSQKDAVNEINLLKQKMSELELSLEKAVLRVPKDFPSVRFLNYKDRKRILVMNYIQVMLANW